MALTRSSSRNSDDYKKIANIGIVHTKQYDLNIEKSLHKKLKCANRKQITYEFTHGGFTAKLDAVTFELFHNACEIYCIQSANSFYNVCDDISKANLAILYRKHTKLRKI